MLDHVPDLVMAFDRDGTIMFITMPSGAKPRIDDAVGTSGYAYIPPDQEPRMRAVIERAFDEGVEGSYEVQDAGTGDWYSTRVGPLVRNGRDGGHRRG